MNKAELVDAVAVESGLTKSDASGAVECVFNTIGNQLRQGNSVSVVGLASFQSVSARLGQGVIRGPVKRLRSRLPGRLSSRLENN